MKKILSAAIALLSYSGSQAQMPDTTAIRTEQLRLQQQQKEISTHIRTARHDIRELKAGVRSNERDSMFDKKWTGLKAERDYWKKEYRAWQHNGDLFEKKKETFDRAMLGYYRTQPFFKYERRRRLNLAAGVTLVSSGGLVLFGGLLNAMMESPGASAAVQNERRKQENKVMLICTASGASLALCSIPFFIAAHRNKEQYQKHIVWNIDVRQFSLPDGSSKETVGFIAHIPLFIR